MSAIMPPSHDPAPSRALYRLQRLWLTPTIRFFVHVGLPLLALAWVGWQLAQDPKVRAAVAERVEAVRDSVAGHPALMVERVELGPMSPGIAPLVRAALDIRVPASAMDLDIGALHDKVLALDAVKSASLRVEGMGVLRVDVVERTPVLLWWTDGGLQLLDAEGVRMGPADQRADWPDLPLVSGTGADKRVAEAQELIARARPVADQLRGLVRVGERRWTLVLRNGIDIMLPEEGAAAALSRVMALHAAEDVLNRHLLAVDMRDRRRPILRLTPEALYELRKARGIIGEEDA